ncbi:AF17 protein, partial [Poecile atricapillus]|nr:AF17 protein [Poecile atricapillus]
MEPIVLQYVPHDRFNKTCYICEEQGRESKAASGACMACNRHGCRQAFHVTCAQMAGLLCEEEVLEVDNVKYCGYCKYHFNKMVSAGNSRDSGTLCRFREFLFLPGIFISFGNSICFRNSSRKDKERPKQKHKKRPESPSSLPPAPPAVAAEKPKNWEKWAGKSSQKTGKKGQENPGKTLGKGAGKSSQKTGKRGRKIHPGNPAKKTGERAVKSSPKTGKRGCSSCGLPASQDLLPFPKLEQEDEKFRKASGSASSSRCSPLSEAAKTDTFEQKVIFSGFGSVMRFSTSAAAPPRARDASPVDYKGSGGAAAGSAAGHKRMPPLGAEEGEGLKEKKHKGSKKNKHGPGRPKAGKGKEVLGAQLAGSTSTSSSPFSGGSLVSSSVGNSSRSFGHPGSLPSLSVESPLLGSGVSSLEGSLYVLRALCQKRRNNEDIPPFPTQVFSLAGSTFSLPSSHIFGSPLTSGLSLNPLLSQPESSRAGTDPEAAPASPGIPSHPLTALTGKNSIPKSHPYPSLSPFPVSCPSIPCPKPLLEPIPALEPLQNLAPGNSGHIQEFVEMLKALHSLQKENQRLQEQIMTLTAKKERLQLLNVQLSVPFPVVTSSNGAGSQAQYILPANVCAGDSLSISKSPPCKNSFGIENSLSTSSEDPHSGCPSRSSSSLSFHSTPPPLPMLQPSPASLPLPGAQQVNGLARLAGGGLAGGSGAGHSLSAVPMVDGLLGSLAGAQQMPLNGILGSLNGAQPAPPPSALSQASGPPALQLSTSLSSVASLSPLTEQQRHVLQQHEQQLQQLQQLLTSQPLNPVRDGLL